MRKLAEKIDVNYLAKEISLTNFDFVRTVIINWIDENSYEDLTDDEEHTALFIDEEAFNKFLKDLKNELRGNE